MWFIGVEVEQETSAPPPKKNPGSALVKHDWVARAVYLIQNLLILGGLCNCYF